MGSQAIKTKAKSAAQETSGSNFAPRSKAVRNILRAGVQPKLKIGAVNDPAEIEADRVADQVMRMPISETLVAPSSPPLDAVVGYGHGANPSTIHRKCASCADEKIQRKDVKTSTPVIRRRASGGERGGAPASAAASSAINSLGSGSPLPASERSFFEPRFGQDLSGVRIHTGGIADTASRAINAKAFTLGNNIAFASGHYSPGSNSGRHLMAHELTHTIQQSSGAPTVRRATLDILPADFVGPPNVNQRHAAASCDVRCDADSVGALHTMPLFYHTTRGGPLASNAGANGIGASLHFLAGSSLSAPSACSNCSEYKMIQVINSNAPADPRGNSFVDNASRSTPFYDDVGRRGSGLHTIPSQYEDGGNQIDTTKSIYDTPYRQPRHLTSLSGTNFYWNAETCVTCKKIGKDKILSGCTTYGFRMPWNGATRSHGPVQAIGPACRASPSAHFTNTLTNDASTSGYQFET